MSASVERALPGPEREAIRRAVAETESATSAEIVVYVVGESDPYEQAPWRAAAWFALLAAVVQLVLVLLRLELDSASFEVVTYSFLVPVIVSALAGALLTTRLDWLRREFTTAALRRQRVLDRAERAFLSVEVFATRDRTGVLLFVSLFEHIVCVLPDRGVRDEIDPGEWSAITQEVAEGIAAGRLGESLCRGVEASGRLLAAHGLETRRDDENELDDRVRVD